MLVSIVSCSCQNRFNVEEINHLLKYNRLPFLPQHNQATNGLQWCVKWSWYRALLVFDLCFISPVMSCQQAPWLRTGVILSFAPEHFRSLDEWLYHHETTCSHKSAWLNLSYYKWKFKINELKTILKIPFIPNDLWLSRNTLSLFARTPLSSPVST